MLRGNQVLYLHLLRLLIIQVFPRASELLVKPVDAFRAYGELSEKQKQRTCGNICREYKCVSKDCRPKVVELLSWRMEDGKYHHILCNLRPQHI